MPKPKVNPAEMEALSRNVEKAVGKGKPVGGKVTPRKQRFNMSQPRQPEHPLKKQPPSKVEQAGDHMSRFRNKPEPPTSVGAVVRR